MVLCPHFEPDTAPTGVVVTRIVGELAARGHRLDVVTSLPWYERHAIEAGYSGRLVRRSRTDWGSVTRVHPFPAPKQHIARRAASFGAFSALVAGAGSAGGRADGVLAVSPPLTMGFAGATVAAARRAPLVFNVQDVFPDVAVEVGVLTGRRLVAVARRLELMSYRLADAVTVLSTDLAENLVAKVGPAGAHKIRVIPNFVDTTAITPGPRQNGFRRELGVGDRPVVMYAGNVGLSQPLHLLVDAARHLPDAAVVIVGNGVARGDLMARARGLDNVRFAEFQPVERLAEVLATADVHTVLLRPGLGRASVPSKLYSILAAGRPFVAGVDLGTEVARVAERHGTGLAVAPGDGPALVAALRCLLDDPGRAVAIGARGRRFVESWASPAAVAESYENLFEELAGRREPSPPSAR